MAKKVIKDLIRSVCGGAEERFGGIPCQYYDLSTGECNLLKKGKMEEVFEKGRCQPSRMLTSSVEIQLELKRDLFDKVVPGKKYGYFTRAQKDYIKSIVFMIIARGLKEKKLKKGYDITFLKGYLNRCAYNEVQTIFKNEGLLVKKLSCGKCVFLFESKPRTYTCQRKKFEVIEKGEKRFEDNPFYEKARKASDAGCKWGWKPYRFETIDEHADRNGEDSYSPKTPDALTNNETVKKSSDIIEVEAMKTMLRNRVKEAKQRSLVKQYDRQYTIFTKLHSLLAEHFSIDEAIGIIAETIGKSKKTIKRDITGIREYFGNNMGTYA